MIRRIAFAVLVAAGGLLSMLGIGVVALFFLSTPFDDSLDNSPSSHLAVREVNGVLEVVVLTSCSATAVAAPDLRVGDFSTMYDDFQRIASTVGRSDAPRMFRVIPEQAAWEANRQEVVSLALDVILADGVRSATYGVSGELKDLGTGITNEGPLTRAEFEEAVHRCR
jgi:hypothetical protein